MNSAWIGVAQAGLCLLPFYGGWLLGRMTPGWQDDARRERPSFFALWHTWHHGPPGFNWFMYDRISPAVAWAVALGLVALAVGCAYWLGPPADFEAYLPNEWLAAGAAALGYIASRVTDQLERERGG